MNCLDAETLAAWFDGGLSGAALEEVRLHVAGCARCQALVGAMGHTRSAVPAAEPERSPRWWLAWAVPAAAAATAVAIWVAVPHPATVAVNPAPASSLQKQEGAPQTPAPESDAAQPAEPASPATSTQQAPAPPAETVPQPRADTAVPPAARDSVDQFARQTPANATESAAIAAAPSAERREVTERQGAVAGQLQARAALATNVCGPTWPSPPADIAGQITAGSAPSDDVCWIAGRGGVVMRSTDHRTWQRLNFPVPADLSSVTATDVQSATVVTTDGRTFSTADGAVTWQQR